MTRGHCSEAFMSAILALLYLNFSDSSPASWDDRQAASTGHKRIHFLNFDFFRGKLLQVYRPQFCQGQILITHILWLFQIFFSNFSLFQTVLHYMSSKPYLFGSAQNSISREVCFILFCLALHMNYTEWTIKVLYLLTANFNNSLFNSQSKPALSVLYIINSPCFTLNVPPGNPTN